MSKVTCVFCKGSGCIYCRVEPTTRLYKIKKWFIQRFFCKHDWKMHWTNCGMVCMKCAKADWFTKERAEEWNKQNKDLKTAS